MKLKKFNYKKVKSTNQTAIKLIQNFKKEFGLVVAETQINGRGQYGRKWISYKGNTFLSFFYSLEKINLSMALLTKKNCYLVRNTISKYCNKKITFKKPNDLLIDKKKICGILQEKIEKSKKKYLIVGIGINLIKSPNIPNYPTSNLLNFTNRKMNKKKFEQDLKISFENFLSKYYKAS
tara:strand:+ start:2034 stop:2570 length:537 start_codon:yes stop_codon:yes gene_type:complete